MYRVEVYDSHRDLVLAKEFDDFEKAHENAEEVFFSLPREIADNARIQIRDTNTDHITSISFC